MRDLAVAGYLGEQGAGLCNELNSGGARILQCLSQKLARGLEVSRRCMTMTTVVSQSALWSHK